MAVCVEKKLTLSGKTYLFECELLHLNTSSGVLKYVIDREYDVGGIKLHPGDITYALYWSDRPYTLYIWHLSGNQVIYYFNIADKISLMPEEFVWRDLVVDILVDADRNVYVLDENELPENITPEVARHIQTAKSTILSDYRKITNEANAIVSKLLADKR